MNIARQVTIGNSENVAFHDPGDTRVAPVVGFGIHEWSGHLMGVQVCTTAPAPCRRGGHPASCLYPKSVHTFPDLNLLTRSEPVFGRDFTGAETVGVWRQDVMKQIPT